MALFQMRLNKGADGDIMAWLNGQDDKTAAVKAAIRQAMISEPADQPAAPDLGAIRAVIEAALDERFAGAVLGMAVGESVEDPALAGKLDAMF